MNSEYFGDGEFEFTDDWSRSYFQSAHKAITRCELWDWLRNFEPEKDKGFMFTRDVPELDRLREELAKDPINGGHSGASYSITMRNMEYIAKNGYNAFKNSFSNKTKS
jgi:hypothetical protein